MGTVWPSHERRQALNYTQKTEETGCIERGRLDLIGRRLHFRRNLGSKVKYSLLFVQLLTVPRPKIELDT
ncbi:hypothetical protein ILYODFUR_027277 [Ilyodon furcidens]|uniref:Uncharacterized protein n=1 Tax=Ilyodon furcidens TaxID=33524 RepID=A0ABV0VI27_9TELE